MLRHLSLADGFVLAIAYVNDDQRPTWNEYAHALPSALSEARGERTELKHLRGERLALDPCVGAEPAELLTGLLDGVAAAPLPWSLIILDGTRATGPEDDAWIELFERLNERRNALRDGFCGGLVLALHARMEGALARNAPDLWSIRGPVLRVGDAVADPDIEPRHEPSFAASDPARIEECLSDEPLPERRARWRVRATLCAIALQRNDLARRHLDALSVDPCASHPDLRGWRAMLEGELATSPLPRRARAWSAAADALDGDAHWALVTALRLRASDALRVSDPSAALALLDEAAAGIPHDADEVARATLDFEIVSRRIDLLGPGSPHEARALAEALVEELALVHRRTRTNAPQRLIAQAMLRLGDLYARTGERSAALVTWRDASSVVQGLRARDPGRSSWLEADAIIRARIDAATGGAQRQTTSRG